jgi:peptidoglycan/LPS O-acetylase OafA/YrhL
VVINILIQLGMLGSFAAVAPVYAISFALALLSCHLVEKPALALKFRRPGLARTSEAEPAKTL